jgi:translation initiation factor 1
MIADERFAMGKEQKIPVNTITTGWNSPFEKLSTGGLPAAAPAPAKSPQPASPGLGRVVLRRETARRGGKTVIVVHDFLLHIANARIEELATKLKKACGCGGTTKDRTIEIQGDQPGKVRTLLEAEGFRVAGI